MVPSALLELAQILGRLPPQDPVTLQWATQDVPVWVDSAESLPSVGELWTYPDVATAFAVVWYCCLAGGPATARRYDAAPARAPQRRDDHGDYPRTGSDF